jgi:hypothetical protein
MRRLIHLKKLSILCASIVLASLTGCPKEKPDPAKQPTAAAKKSAKTTPPKAKNPAENAATAAKKTAQKKQAGATADRDVARARAVLMPLKKKLMGELKAAMKAGGFAKAIEACKIKAPEITKELNAKGIRVGRTSHKLRNPKNAHDAEWIRKALTMYRKTSMAQFAAKKVETYQLAKLDNGRVGYAEPIYVKPLCLSCHGNKKQVPPKIAKLIDKAFPKDQARGFEEGGFRGLFWVELPKQDAK